ncbi:hypothetical protein BKA24_002828 [Microbacterium marinum]|uniref:Uncharacterized protein n=1 Tax=Microbacterium marinum TaxID=421115 RepID=A0A7W7BV11_9MICO|nr:hypothetical protein [Microbacterium marinum]
MTEDCRGLDETGTHAAVHSRGEVLGWSFRTLSPESWDADAVRPLREAVSEKIQTALLNR